SCCGSAAGVDTKRRESMTDADIKTSVRDTYGRIAAGGGSCCSSDDFSVIGDAYEGVEGYVAEADLSLGCGLPTEEANLQPGHTVLDLGSGAGLDAFVARRIVGEEGRVLGVDMTFEMVQKARENARRLGYDNVSFYLGEIEALPVENDSVDVVISNCVLNLVPDKQVAFNEMFRVIKPGGHFCVSDIVYVGEIPASIRQSVEMYVGCVAGAMERGAYLDGIRKAGFEDVRIVKERAIEVPEDLLNMVLSPEERETIRQSGSAVLSVTVYGEKK
ncbi:MAG: arsenite methyltransferase, partial [Rhodothermales bacterium]